MNETLQKPSLLTEETPFLPQFTRAEANVRSRLSSLDGYYRSKCLNSTMSYNPLTSAAASLLFIADRLSNLPDVENLATLYQSLVHEIKSFESAAQGKGYRTETILAGRFILCCLIDEALDKTAWGKQLWPAHQLLHTFHHDEAPTERFFSLLERAEEDPKMHLDLLELFYLCFCNGYQGKYRDEPSRKELLHQTHELYETIKSHRPEIKSLVVRAQSVVSENKNLEKYNLSKVMISCAAALIAVYFAFNYLITNTTKPIYSQLTETQKYLTNHDQRY